MKAAYEKKIKLICDYIAENLEDDLSLDKLADVAAFSKFHFHRQFRSYTGVNVAKFIRMQRLKRASYQLVFHSELSILDIALNAHFDSPEGFSRAFKRAFEQTPSQFRDDPKWEPWHKTYQFKSQGVTKNMNVQITTFEKRQVAVLEHKGSPESLNHSIAHFIEWRKSTGLSPVKSSETFGVVYHDPKSVKPEDFRFDICGVVTDSIPDNPQGVVNKEIPSGRCAKIRHIGSHDEMESTVHHLYSEWLPNSGETTRDFPVFFHYLNLYPQVPEHELITDIYLPIS